MQLTHIGSRWKDYCFLLISLVAFSATAPLSMSSHCSIRDSAHDDPKNKRPFAFDLANGKPMTFAGLWDAWKCCFASYLA